MIKKLVKHGNSHALIIDKAIMDLLRIGPDTPLEVSTNGEELNVRPVADEARRREFESRLARINRKYGRALKKLAE